MNDRRKFKNYMELNESMHRYGSNTIKNSLNTTQVAHLIRDIRAVVAFIDDKRNSEGDREAAKLWKQKVTVFRDENEELFAAGMKLLDENLVLPPWESP